LSGFETRAAKLSRYSGEADPSATRHDPRYRRNQTRAADGTLKPFADFRTWADGTCRHRHHRPPDLRNLVRSDEGAERTAIGRKNGHPLDEAGRAAIWLRSPQAARAGHGAD